MKSHIGIVLRKELLDIIRDRRSIITALIVPIALYPLMFALMGIFMTSIAREAEENTTIAIINPPAITSYIKENVLNRDGISFIDTGDPLSALENGDAKVVLMFAENAQEQWDQGERVVITLIYDENKSASSMSLELVARAISEYNEISAELKLAERGISLSDLKPFAPAVSTLGELTSRTANNAGMMLSMMLPMLITLYLSIGGLNVSTDLFAGEKERHTMEALLCTRAGRNDILVGKFITVVIYSLVSVATSVAGIVVAYTAFPDVMNMGMADVMGGSGFVIEWQAALFTIGAIMLLAMTFAALQVIISCWSRTVKEAGAYSMPLMFISYIPIFLTMMMQSGDFKQRSAVIPVYNTIGCMKMVLAGVPSYSYMGITLGVSAVFLGAVLGITRMMFKNENIMLRG
ncbi:MAG: ABC transporter permease subunit [Oscillospiraceae bacterium]|nr:ABC transporter permease subunit [Oscillospiraceae bacterium]